MAAFFALSLSGVAGAGVGRVHATERWHSARPVTGLDTLNSGGIAGVVTESCASPGNCAGGGSYYTAGGHSQAFVVGQKNGTWDTARNVPGLQALNVGGSSEVTSVSCGSAGNCAAVGYYHGSAGLQAFVVSEVRGVWHHAQQVPGTATLNVGGRADVTSVSCSGPEDCAAGGIYKDGSGNLQAFVVSETRGVWKGAKQVPGTGTLNAGGNAEVSSVSCASPGNCAAGGFYADSSHSLQAFLVDEKSGRWGQASEVPGSATLNVGGSAAVSSVSCASAGYCTAGGTYAITPSLSLAFVATERNGAWRTAIEVPGLATLDSGIAALSSVSCASAGNCVAGGDYVDASGDYHAYVVNQSDGIWSSVLEVPGSTTLAPNAVVTAVACPSADNCAAGGDDFTDGTHVQAFVVRQTGGTWGRASQVRGSARLNAGGVAELLALSCAATGNCAVGGLYSDAGHHFEAMVDSQVHGAWGKARGVPGLAPLNADGDAHVLSVSCPSAGNCAAGGSYADASSHSQVFVASETNGNWGRAAEIPGSARLNAGGSATLSSLSCASAGSCAAVGSYRDSAGHVQAFVVSETSHRWGLARQAPGSAALNTGGTARLLSVSCASAGACAAAGSYRDSAGHVQALIVIEKNGTWRNAIRIPGLSALNAGGAAMATTVSCASAGNCAVGGSYLDGAGLAQVFVADERNGAWGTAREVPGSALLNAGGSAFIASISCPAAGDCAAGGGYLDGSDRPQALVVTEKNGTWGKAVEVPATAVLNSGGNAAVSSISCPAAGDCTAGGQYASGAGQLQAFVVSETNGTWRNAVEVPGSGSLNVGNSAEVTSISCPSAGNCAAGGFYNSAPGVEAFVVGETNGTWGLAREVPGSNVLNAGGSASLDSVSCSSAGSCGAGGSYVDSSGATRGFIVTSGRTSASAHAPERVSLRVRGAIRPGDSCLPPVPLPLATTLCGELAGKGDLDQ